MVAKRGPDYILLGIVAILLVLGIIVLAGASAPLSISNFGYPDYFLKHQITYGLAVGILIAFIMFKLPLNFLKRMSFIFLILNIIALALVFLPGIGFSAGGKAVRWISLGPITIQPSEFIKLTFLIYISAWLARSKFFKITTHVKSLNLHHPKYYKLAYALKTIWQEAGPFSIVLMLIGILLIFQPDFSTLGIIAASGLAVYFVANTTWWHTILFLVAGVILLISLIFIAPYRLERVSVFFNPSLDPTGIGYQMKQALITIGSGRIFGTGSEISYHQIKFLPAAASDAIFAVFANEVGFVGSVILVSLFILFLWRGLHIAKIKKDLFSRYLTVGIVCWITLQAFINIGAMIGLVPLTGKPLPFISYGGSHIIAELAGVGLLLNISRHP